MDEFIRIRGARQHNLKGIDVDLPRGRMTVITGPSGSGKSSLALDTLFAEGQRRYVESLSTYAKQFLDRMEKPAVESIEGIAPAVAIEQKNPTKSSRSTVGTATEIHDYLRLLFARVGRTHCPRCDRRVLPDTVSSAVERVLALEEGIRIQVAFPLVTGGTVAHRAIVENLRAMGFVRLLADGESVDLGESGAEDPGDLGVDLAAAGEVLVVVDRLVVRPEDRDRLADSLGTAFVEGEGEALVLLGRGPDRIRFTERFRCPDHPEVRFAEPSPQLFSFNNPLGSCPTCTGFGATLEYDPGLIVPNPQRSIKEGAVDPWEKPRYHRERRKLGQLAQEEGVSLTAPWAQLPEAFRETVLHGRKKSSDRPAFGGVIPFLRSKEKKRYKQYIRVFLRQYQSAVPCRECGGARIREQALWIRVGDRTIAQLAELPLEELRGWVSGLTLEGMEAGIAATILRELRARLTFVVDVGLGYLTLARQTRTLSGGEAQRINLANSLGSNLVDTLYVLDEPTVGLHPRDTAALLDLLSRLRDAGNTVVMVEHDTAAMAVADHILELGPGSGEKGGEVVFTGDPEALRSADTATGRFFGQVEGIPVPDRRRPVNGRAIRLEGARLHNVAGVDFEVPLEAMTVVTGVSGSGKSTLIHDVLFRALERELTGGDTSAKQHLGEAVGGYDRVEGLEHLQDVVLVDQSPIGRTPRSNPVTYIKAYDEIRAVFAKQPRARELGLTARDFSFNVEGGRCPECKGAGRVEIEMVFMADVFVPCDACRGTRFRSEVLEVEFRGRNIAQVLDLTVDEAIRFFLRHDRLGRTLWQLQQVGLGYLRLGQPAPTLSGGEAQRLKIARELVGAGKVKGRKLYILDEPTTGLSGEDVRKLLRVLGRLLDQGNTVLVIEHNLDVIKVADWIVDMGPGAGGNGGRLVAMGPPEDVARVPESVTGRFLAPLLEAGEPPRAAGQGPAPGEPPS